MEKSTKKKLKKIFNLYNLAIVACVILIVVSLVIIIEPDFSGMFKSDNNVVVENKEVTDKNQQGSKENTEPKKSDDVKVVANDNSGEKISEKDARKLAKKQFKELGEKDIDTDALEVLKVEREGQEYYYISSAENTVEISVKTGEITRINSVKVEK